MFNVSLTLDQGKGIWCVIFFEWQTSKWKKAKHFGSILGLKWRPLQKSIDFSHEVARY